VQVVARKAFVTSWQLLLTACQEVLLQQVYMSEPVFSKVSEGRAAYWTNAL
jgi:hypothetical protein